tara:strand:- start:938 stop:1360 length:423 start_codon:yes stop_codon:yes gene_type:complete
MTENFKIFAEFIKDLSSETKDLETYLHVKDNLKNYNLNIEITSKPLKNRFIEVNTKLAYLDTNDSENKSFFELTYATVVKIDEKIEDRKEIEKIILCDVQNKIYKNLEKAFINLINDSGYPGIKIEKKIDFEKLYNQKFN